MKWRGRRTSGNIEDRRRSGGGAAAGGIGGLGVVAVVVIGYFLGIDVTPLLNGLDQGQGGSVATQGNVELTEADARAAEFSSVVLADTEEVWTRIFREQLNQTYAAPILVLFKGTTQSACGGASAASGPFYCPSEQKAFLDTEFFVTMEQQLGAGGDFAAAYVIAHEIGHHVQNVLGILDQANRVRAQVDEVQSNAISVRIELQADCFAGIWANAVQEQFGTLEPNDIAEALNAAEQIGDDMLQRNAGRTVQPHTFTHGTSAQRQRWFTIGYESGLIDQCDTLNATQL